MPRSPSTSLPIAPRAGPVHRIVAVLLAALAASFSSGGSGLAAQASDASGTDVLRIEQEDKLLVPLERAEEVWEFLRGWLVEDVDALRSLDPELTSTWSEERFYDTYFDTPELTLLARDDGLRFRQRFNLTNPADPKHGRALIQIKLNAISDDALERGEFKYDVAEPIDPSRSLSGIVRRSDREALHARLLDLGLDPRAIQPILTIEDRRRRIYLSRRSSPFLSVSHDHVTVRKLWATIEFVEIEPELNEVAYTEADSATRAYMAEIGERISDAVLERFPEVERDLTPKYGKAFGRLAPWIPGFRTLVRFGLHDADGVAAVAVIGLGLVGVAGTATLRSVRSWRADRELPLPSREVGHEPGAARPFPG